MELTAAGLHAVCGARFTRRYSNVELSEGVFELALDKGVLIGGGREMPFCEVEVELKEGTSSLVDTYGTVMAQMFRMTEEPRSKFSRALALARGEEDGF